MLCVLVCALGLARLFCFACDMGFGEVDLAGGLRIEVKV